MPYSTPGDEPLELAYEEDEILHFLKTERLNSIGFEGDDELAEQRETALDYIKGQMDDLKALTNRSKVVSTDVADAIETVLPDLVEILTGGEDVGTFRPEGEEDEKAAKQETAFIGKVIFEHNPGFFNMTTAIRDALEVKTGILKFYYKDDETEETTVEGLTAEGLDYTIAQGSEPVEVQPADEFSEDVPLFDATFRNVLTKGRECIEPVNPMNFGVSPDTVRLADTPYCVERSYPRAYQLIDEGYDPDIVERLHSSNRSDTEQQDSARDTVEEFDDDHTLSDNERRTVEIHTHTIRHDMAGTGKSELWCFVTDADEKMILDAYRKSRVGYAAGTPYMRAHRFYGFSVADKLIEIQRIKTVLQRMLLDSGYYATQPRFEVSEQEASENTIKDLLRNEPGYPVRSRTGNAVRPLVAGALNFDVKDALEFFATVGEQRSGIMRNAQGLDPDTLHKTATGAVALLSAAQRRTRMIARVLAETLLRDLFVGVHGDIREHGNRPQKERLRGEWVPIDPTAWGNRSDMTITLGVGSGGKDNEAMALKEVIGLQTQAAEGQQAGVIGVPLVNEQTMYEAATDYCARLGLKTAERYFLNPAEAQNAPQQQPEDDGRAEAEMMLQVKMKEAEIDAQVEMFKAQKKAEIDSYAAQQKAQLDRERAEFEAEMATQRAEYERQIAMMTAQQPNGADFHPGGRLDR